MDNFLPCEMLAKVASFLSYRDVNSLIRTSKTAHAKLTPYRTTLPKIPCIVRLSSLSEQIRLAVYFNYNQDVWKERTAYLGDRREDGADEFTEEENRDLVVGFYKGTRDPTHDVSTLQGRLEELPLHIHTIQTLATVEKLVLFNVENDGPCEELARLLTKWPSRIDSLILSLKDFSQSHLAVLIACKPRILTTWAPQLPDKFYKFPVVRRLTELDVSCAVNTVHDLSLLRARKIKIHGRNNIAIDDVEQIISQWAESKRQIECISLDFGETMNEDMCTESMEHLDSRLVQVEPDAHQEWKWLLTRRCDAVKLSFCVSYRLDISSCV